MAKVTRLTLDNSGELDRRRLNFREISGDAPLESVGQDLRKARERKGEELDHIARVLKVRRDYLLAIEEGAMEALPGRAYAIGFVRSYAAYLGLKGEDYVDWLKAEVAGREDKETPPSVAPRTEGIWPHSGWVVGALFVAAVVYAGYYMFFAAPQLAEQPVIPVPERLVAEAGLTPAAVQQPAPAPLPASATVANANAPSPAPAATLPPGRKFGLQNTGARITLRVHRESLVTVLGVNNQFFLNRVLLPGDTYLVPNLAGLTLKAPDAGAVELILDGNSVGFAGQNGVAADGLPLNTQALAERRNRG
jgi:cytoskeleton protein RodZ